MKTKDMIYDIVVKHRDGKLWCVCKQEPGVYGYYDNEGSASIDLKNQLKVELSYKHEKDMNNENININFVYE